MTSLPTPGDQRSETVLKQCLRKHKNTQIRNNFAVFQFCRFTSYHMLAHKTLLPYTLVPQLAKTDVAYATGDALLKPFFVHEPQPGAFADIIRLKAQYTFPRAELVSVLKRQYAQLPVHPEVAANIEALGRDNTFTVVTAHQPSLLLGPLYFIYKALTTINLAETVNSEAAGTHHIVPVFVLGSEDHDIEEVNKINLFGKRLVWQPETEGPTGTMDTASMLPVLEELRGILGESESAAALFDRIQRACQSAHTFADVNRALLHEFLGKYGLVVIDMNDPALKRHFIPVVQAELEEQAAFHLVSQSIAQLNQSGFKTQAAPREINLFYMKPGMRQRIVLENGIYQVLHTNLSFSPAEIMAELDQHPERFSPNVVLRPLYQEMILPNLAYVGGGGELAYWLERRTLFQHFNIPFPMLLRRNSVLWLDRDAQKKLGKFGFSATQFFEDTEHLVRQYIETNASGEVGLSQEIADLRLIFDRIAAKASAIDPTLEKAVRADEVKSVGGLEQWEGRLVRAEKQKHEVTLNQMRGLKEKLFPNHGLQERTDNILPYLLKYGDDFIQTLKEHLDPFDAGFVILEER